MTKSYSFFTATTRIVPLVLLILTAPSACGGGDGDEAADDDSVDDADDDTEDDTTEEAVQPTLASIQENIFTPTCSSSSCHGGGNPQAGLLLTDGNSFSELVGVPSTESDLNRVEPGDPDASYLIHKLEGTQGTVGGSGVRMPRGASPLSDEEIEVVRQWITDGAEDN